MTSHLKFPEALKVPHGFMSRNDGVSLGVYEGLNCGPGSDDDPDLVRENRRIAASIVSGRRDTPLVSCYQVHGATAVQVTADWADERPKADAMVTKRPGIILGILTADCTPVLFADTDAGVVGAAHAGWQGALKGIIESTVALMEQLGAHRKSISAVIGPTIAQQSYEVDNDFEARFLKQSDAYSRFFDTGKDASHQQFNLPAFVVHKLSEAGIEHIVDSGIDTYSDEQYFSYRRTTHRNEPDYGRQVSAIMLAR